MKYLFLVVVLLVLVASAYLWVSQEKYALSFGLSVAGLVSLYLHPFSRKLFWPRSPWNRTK